MALDAPKDEPLSPQEVADVVVGQCSRETKKDSWGTAKPGRFVDVLIVDAQGNVVGMERLPVLAEDSDNRNVGIGKIVPGTTNVRFCLVRECDREVFMLPDGKLVTRLPADMKTGSATRKTMPGEPEHSERDSSVKVAALWGISVATAFFISGLLYYGCSPTAKQAIEQREKLKTPVPADPKKAADRTAPSPHKEK